MFEWAVANPYILPKSRLSSIINFEETTSQHIIFPYELSTYCPYVALRTSDTGSHPPASAALPHLPLPSPPLEARAAPKDGGGGDLVPRPSPEAVPREET